MAGQSGAAWFCDCIKEPSPLDDLSDQIGWDHIARILGSAHASKKGELSLPRTATFKPWLLAGWYHLWDVKLAEARDDRALFRTFCGFSRTDAKPERTAFLRFRKAPIAQKLQCPKFTVMTAQLKSKAAKAVAAQMFNRSSTQKLLAVTIGYKWETGSLSAGFVRNFVCYAPHPFCNR